MIYELARILVAVYLGAKREGAAFILVYMQIFQ